MGTILANPVAIFLAIVVVMNFFARKVSNDLLRTILKIHIHINGSDVSTAFWEIGKFSTVFMYKGSSISTMYQPQLEHVCAIKIATNAGDVKTDFHGIFGVFYEKITKYIILLIFTK